MAELRYIVRDYTLFIDGVLYSGSCEEVNEPKLSKKMEEYQGGGMDLPMEIQLGHEKLEMDFALNAEHPLLYQTYGLAENVKKIFKVYTHTVAEDGSESGSKMEVLGVIRDLEPDAKKPGSKYTTKFSLGSISYYKKEISDVTVLEIDVMNKVFASGGVDRNINARRFLGL